MALAYTDLRKGILLIYNGEPYEVIEANFLRMQQRKAVVQTKIRNLMTGKILDRNWQGSDSFEEAEVEQGDAQFIYESKGDFWFHEVGNPKNRFAISGEVVGEPGHFLKTNTVVKTMSFNGKIIQVKVPIKMDLIVKDAPPGIKGNTAQGGSKLVTLENGAQVQVPLFIDEGEVIRVNTETGQYVERVGK
jgi:elongation factor P